jgi:hypothetical protein
MSLGKIDPAFEVIPCSEIVRLRSITASMRENKVRNNVSGIQGKGNKVVYITAAGDAPVAIKAATAEIH